MFYVQLHNRFAWHFRLKEEMQSQSNDKNTQIYKYLVFVKFALSHFAGVFAVVAADVAMLLMFMVLIKAKLTSHSHSDTLPCKAQYHRKKCSQQRIESNDRSHLKLLKCRNYQMITSQ